MHTVAETLRMQLSQCPFSCVRWIGCAHDLPVTGDGILSLKDHQQDGAAGHKSDEFLEERLAFMLGVEALRCILTQPFETSCGDAQTFLLRNVR